MSVLTTPGVLVAAIALNLVIGLGVLAWARKMTRQGDWLALLGIFLLCLPVIAVWAGQGQWSFEMIRWSRGWILPRTEPAALGVGILQDTVGFVFILFSAGISALLLVNRGLRSDESFSHRTVAAASIGLAGVSLSWLALTPWLAVMGVALTATGGFILLGSHRTGTRDAGVALAYFRQRAAGVVLILSGAFLFVSTQASFSWGLPVEMRGDRTFESILGTAMVLAGALLQMQAFPFLGSVVQPADTGSSERLILAHLFPASAAFAILVRLQAHLDLAAFGWIALISAFFTAVCGLLQKDWKRALAVWASTGFSTAVAALVLAGTWAGLSIFLSALLTASAISVFGSALTAGGATSKSHQKRAIAAKIGILFAAASGTGLIGFLSCGGRIRWLAQVLDDPALLAGVGVILFLLALLGWRAAWMAFRLRKFTQASWGLVLSPWLIVFLSVGVLWTGSISGGALPQFQDLAFVSAFTRFLTYEAQEVAYGSFLNASWIHWASFSLAAILGAWLTSRAEDPLSRAAQGNSFLAGVAGGYGYDRVTEGFAQSVRSVGTALQSVVDHKLWDRWLPHLLLVAARESSRAAVSTSDTLTGAFNRTFRQLLDVPSKYVRLLQSGDVQWYLLFGVGAAIAILLHFLRFQ